jgi:hypothetical protein
MVLVHITGQNLSLVRLPGDTGVKVLRHCENSGTTFEVVLSIVLGVLSPKSANRIVVDDGK